MSDSLVTLDGLSSQVALALSVDYHGPPNDRVRHIPDRRAIRYYTTLGLMDRPAQMRGRTALYRRRHLLQLVAIKRLQGQGLSLQDVQQRLLGLTDSELSQLARLPEGIDGRVPEAPPEDVARRREFGKETPVTAAMAPERAATSTPTVMQGVALSDRTVLLAPLRRLPDAADLQAIQAAAAPLLHLLEKRSLLG